MHRITAVVAAALLAVAGCATDDHDPAADGGHHHHAGTDQDDHGCDHLAYGPHHAIEAARDRASAPAIGTMSDSRIALPAGAAGYVRFTAGTAGDHAIYLTSKDVPLALEDAAGKTVAPESHTTRIARCSRVKAKYVFHLEAGAVAFVKLGPASAATTVSLVLVQPLTGGGTRRDGGGAHHGG